VESSFSKKEALSPVVEGFTAARGGMEECPNVSGHQNGQLDNSVTDVQNLGRTPAAWEASPDVRGPEDRLEVQDEVPSNPLVSDFGVETFPDEEQASFYKRETITCTLSKMFSEHPILLLFSFVFVTVIITTPLTYLTFNKSDQLKELHKSVSMLKDELSKSYSSNKELTLKNADLGKHMTESEASSSELKDKNNELKVALQFANSELSESRDDLDVLQATSLRAKSEIQAKLLEIANTRIELEGLRILSGFLKAESGGSFILDPVWLKSGESVQILEGRLTIRPEQASSQESCSDVIVQLSSSQPGFASPRGINQYNKTLCPRLGIPENFRLKNNRCSVLLLGSKTNNDGAKAYLVTVFRK
jgi:regulator of replication initiation timing